MTKAEIIITVEREAGRAKDAILKAISNMSPYTGG